MSLFVNSADIWEFSNSVGIFLKVLSQNLLCFGWCQSGELVTCLESGDLYSLG